MKTVTWCPLLASFSTVGIWKQKCYKGEAFNLNRILLKVRLLDKRRFYVDLFLLKDTLLDKARDISLILLSLVNRSWVIFLKHFVWAGLILSSIKLSLESDFELISGRISLSCLVNKSEKRNKGYAFITKTTIKIYLGGNDLNRILLLEGHF